MKMWEESSWSRGRPASRSKLEISFLLNPKTGPQKREDSSTTTTPGIADECIYDFEAAAPTVMQSETAACLEGTQGIIALEDEPLRTISPFEMKSSAKMGSEVSISEEWMRFVPSKEDKNHETGYMDKPREDGTRHISLSSGELITHWATTTKKESAEQKKGALRRKSLQNKLKEKRVSLASQVSSIDFRRMNCCKRMRCFEKVDQDILRKCVKETLLMGTTDRRARLKSWLMDGVFVFHGKRVCSAFLARAFWFSRDLQRAVRICDGRATNKKR